MTGFLNSLPDDFKDILKSIRVLKFSDPELEFNCRHVVYDLRDIFVTKEEGSPLSEALQKVNPLGYSFGKLVEYLDSTDFYTAPASTIYHGSYRSGLALHSLKMLRRVFLLSSSMLPEIFNVESGWLVYWAAACLGHDFCKIGLYEVSSRNVKNDVTGQWEKVPYYKAKDDYVSLGHGVESLSIIENYMGKLPVELRMAVVWHMGAYGETKESGRLTELRHAIEKYPEVLIWQTADMLATTLDNA
jgi:hypothetical protein